MALRHSGELELRLTAGKDARGVFYHAVLRGPGRLHKMLLSAGACGVRKNFQSPEAYDRAAHVFLKKAIAADEFFRTMAGKDAQGSIEILRLAKSPCPWT
jgi:hypothetical protein